jgi:hypothetical protein
MIGRRLFSLFFFTSVVMVLWLALLKDAAAQDSGEDFQQPGRLAAAVNWLVTIHQNSDGGYSAFSGGADLAPSDVGGTVDALLAIAAAGYNPASPVPGRENAPLGYLQNDATAVAAYAGQDGGKAGKLVLALTATAQDPRDFLGYNFVISLTNHLSPTGQYGVNTAFEQSLALLALHGLGDAQPAPEAVAWLVDAQDTAGDVAGSWSDGFGTDGNVDATAMAIMALLPSLGADDPAIIAARDFLARSQLPAGGWEYGPGFGANANSTALAIQAMHALGEDFYSPESEWAVDGRSPLATLLSWQGESGAFQADFGEGPFDDFFTTVQALPALAGRSYPLPGRLEAARQAVACLATLQDPLTAGWESFPGSGVDAGGTARAIEALAAFGDDPAGAQYAVNGASPLDALAALAPDYLATGRGGRVGTLLQGVVAGGGDPTDFAGYHLVISVTNYLSPTGEYAATSFGPYAHNQSILGLLAAGEAVDPAAVAWLVEAQADGGWGDVDGTASSVQVLAQLDRPVAEALNYLSANQLADGGWGFAVETSPSSTAEVGQALILAGENPFAPAWSMVLSGTVQNSADAVLALQGADGCWPNAFGPGNDPFSTVDGIMLLVGDPPFGHLDPAGIPITETDEAATTGEPVPTVAAEATSPAVAMTIIEPTATPVPSSTPAEAGSPTVTPETVAEAAETVDSTEEEAPPSSSAGETSSADENLGVAPIVAVVLISLAFVSVLGAALYYRRPR